MGSEWRNCKLGDVCEFVSGTVFPKDFQGALSGAYPFIKVSDMNLPENERLIKNSNNWITEDMKKKLRAKLHPAGATVFAKIGIALTYNRRRMLTRQTIIDNNMMSAVPDQTVVDQLFFYYLLCTVDFNQVASGTALPYLNISDLLKIEISLPPLPEQKAIAHILGSLDDGKARFVNAVAALSQAFALVVPHEYAIRIRDEVGFFQVVKAYILKKPETKEDKRKDRGDIELAVRQIISRAIVPGGVMDIFEAAGLKKPDISILDEKFLEEVKKLPYKNLVLEALKKLLNDEIKTLARKNLVMSRSFSVMLEESVRKYHNKTVEAAVVIEELIALAKEIRESRKRGGKLGMSEDELAFYDALEVNDSAVKVLGDETLRTIAHELVEAIRRNVTIDWAIRENVRARMRAIVKRILRKYGYPPDKQESVTNTVIEQAELLCESWVSQS